MAEGVQGAFNKRNKTKRFHGSKRKIQVLPVNSLDGVSYLFYGLAWQGIIMPRTYKPLYVLWAIIINLIVTLYLPVGFVIGCVLGFRHGKPLGDILTAMQVGINIISSAIKFLLIFYFLPRLRDCEPLIHRLDHRCATSEQRSCIRRFMRHGNQIFVAFVASYWIYSTLTVFSGILQHQLPYNIYNPLFDAHKNLFNYIVTVILEFLLVLAVCFQDAMNDTISVIYVAMIRSHLEALMQRIEQMRAADGSRDSENVEELKLIILDHKNILELHKRITPVVSTITFVQFCLTGVVLGITLINVMVFSTSLAARLASISFVVALMVELSPLCYYAQCLMEESSHLCEFIFHTKWVDQNRRFRTMLVFFMQHSQQVLQFSAANFVPITVNTFLNIAKFSFSLLTLVQQMNFKERFGIET